MDTIYTPAVGDYIRALDLNGDVVGGGTVLNVDMYYVTVAQPFAWRHKGVVTERGTTTSRFSLSAHAFERLITYICCDCPWGVTARAGDAEQDAYNHSQEYKHCVPEGDTSECGAYCGRSDH